FGSCDVCFLVAYGFCLSLLSFDLESTKFVLCLEGSLLSFHLGFHCPSELVRELELSDRDRLYDYVVGCQSLLYLLLDFVLYSFSFCNQLFSIKPGCDLFY